MEMFPALQQRNFKCCGNQLVDGKADKMPVFEKDMQLLWLDGAISVCSVHNKQSVTLTLVCLIRRNSEHLKRPLFSKVS